MATRYCQQQIEWIVMNSLFLRVAAALIMAVGIAGLIGGTVLCRGNTIEIINSDSVQGIYPEMGIPVILFSLFIELVGLAIACIICIISRKYESVSTAFYRRPDLML
uniref:Tetraspanin n=1 Tax=Echinococcus canadensis TaxID=519352 RepID=A0A915EVA9_9CEST